MTGETIETPLAAGRPGPARRETGTWQVSGQAVATVTCLELRQRVRSSRWAAALGVWVLALGALATLMHYALFSGPSGHRGQVAGAGPTMFGWVLLLVLTLGSLVAPALSATSINGDRAAGVLATLQVTLLSPAEIVLGKLLAAWLTTLVFLAVSIPFTGWAVLSGGTPPGRLAGSLALLAVMLLTVCAVGLGWSALTPRAASSIALTYLSVAFTGLGLPLIFALLVPVVTTQETHTVRHIEQLPQTVPIGVEPVLGCVTLEQHPQTVVHYERIWWVLAAHPLVVIADAVPAPGQAYPGDVLTQVRTLVRGLQRDEPPAIDTCRPGDPHGSPQRLAGRERPGVVWPYGLAAELSAGAGFTALAVRRLRTPARRVPRGTRVT